MVNELISLLERQYQFVLEVLYLGLEILKYAQRDDKGQQRKMSDDNIADLLALQENRQRLIEQLFHRQDKIDLFFQKIDTSYLLGPIIDKINHIQEITQKKIELILEQDVLLVDYLQQIKNSVKEDLVKTSIQNEVHRSYSSKNIKNK